MISEQVTTAGVQAASLTAAVEEEDEGEVDETGVEPKDVELVMTQVRKFARSTNEQVNQYFIRLPIVINFYTALLG